MGNGYVNKKEEILALRTQVKALTDENRDLEEAFKQMQAESERFREQVRTLQGQLAASEERGRMILDAKNEMLDTAREHVRTLTAERDASLTLLRDARATLTGLAPELSEHAFQELACHLDDEPSAADGSRIATQADALRARVAELEAREERIRFEGWAREESLKAECATAVARAEQAEGQQRSDMAKVDRWRKEVESAHLLLDRAGQSPVQPDLTKRIEALLAKCDEGWEKAKSARDAALEEAASPLAGRGPHVQVNAQTEANRIRAIKAQPARRFVEAERADAERREAWIHGIETAAGIVAECGEDVQPASVIYGSLKARVEFERSQLGLSLDEVKP